MQQKSLSVYKAKSDLKHSDKNLESSGVIGYLQDFGLTEKEAKIYYVLSRLGSASANEISNASQFNRLQTYRSVKGLVDSGLVEISLERPRRYTPLKIEHAISLLQQEAQNRIIQLEAKKPLLLQKWSEIPDFPISKNSYTFRIIQGSKNVSKFAIMLYESAEKNIDFIIKGSDLMRWVLEGADDILQESTKKQVYIRGISNFDKTNILGIERFQQFCEINHTLAPDLAPLILIDNKEVLIGLTNEANNSVPENAIWTNHPNLVGMLKTFFNTLWASSKDGELMAKEINLKRAKL